MEVRRLITILISYSFQILFLSSDFFLHPLLILGAAPPHLILSCLAYFNQRESKIYRIVLKG